MKKLSFLLLTILLSWNCSMAQVQEGPLTPSLAQLKINGTGQLRVAPDQAVINMTVKAIHADINDAVRELNTKTEKLNRRLNKAGFKHEEIKTSQMNVQENGQWRNGEYVDSGYVATQSIELKFKRDPERMAKLLDAFSDKEGAEALFHFGFSLSDEARQQAQEQLIQKAIEDARNKARVIAGAAGIQLGKIRNIVYGQPEYRPVPMYSMDMMAESRSAQKQQMAEMEVQEIEMQDQITIYWEFE